MKKRFHIRNKMGIKKVLTMEEANKYIAKHKHRVIIVDEGMALIDNEAHRRRISKNFFLFKNKLTQEFFDRLRSSLKGEKQNEYFK